MKLGSFNRCRRLYFWSYVIWILSFIIIKECGKQHFSFNHRPQRHSMETPFWMDPLLTREAPRPQSYFRCHFLRRCFCLAESVQGFFKPILVVD